MKNSLSNPHAARLILAIIFVLATISSFSQTTFSDKKEIVTLTPKLGMSSMATIEDSLQFGLPYNALRIGVLTTTHLTKSFAVKFDYMKAFGEGDFKNFASYHLNYNKGILDLSFGNMASVTTILRPYPPLHIVSSMFESKPMTYIGAGGLTVRAYISPIEDLKIGVSVSEKGNSFLDSTQYAATIEWKGMIFGTQICDGDYAVLALYKSPSKNLEQFIYYENSRLFTGYTFADLEKLTKIPIQIKAEYCFDFNETDFSKGRNLFRFKVFTPIEVSLFTGCVYLMVDNKGTIGFGAGVEI
jgi:hypothetical protein